MSARSRRRLRRTSRKRNPFLLTLLVLGSCLALATMGFGVWVISVAAEAPPIEELQPVDVGENSRPAGQDPRRAPGGDRGGRGLALLRAPRRRRRGGRPRRGQQSRGGRDQRGGLDDHD